MASRLMIALLALPLAGCNGEAPSAVEEAPIAEMATSHEPADVIGKTWYWLGTTTPVERIVVNDPSRYTLLLHEDGDAELRFDCNRGGGAYEIGTGSISFGPLMSTRAACPEDSLDQAYMRQLENVAIFFVEGGDLYIDQRFDSGTMRFGLSPGAQ